MGTYDDNEEEYDEGDGDDDPSAYLANPAYCSEGEEEEEYEEEDTAYLAGEEEDIDEEDIECLNAIAYYAATFGVESLDDYQSLDAFVEAQMTAFAAFRNKGRSKGKGKLRPSNVSLQDRREIMA